MALSAGTRLGPYEILAPIGAGGMGEVYRARDTKLRREVAIKTLPPEVTGDSERLARFEREAHLLASLNHPHIAAIYGLEEAGGKPFLILELVEGEDLAERLKRGRVPLDEALEIGRQIAEGLEAAHEKGIVHRDLKPANVKVTSDGKVKVLDFGLAKAWANDSVAGSSNDLSQSPTLAHTGTQAGVILGTAAYMSPEQARGKPADKRADIWAFGVVLFEMLAGRRPFAGRDVAEVLARVIDREPDWNALPGTTPRALERLLRRCLVKSRIDRLHDIGDARLELDEAATEPAKASADGEVRDRPAAWQRAMPMVATLIVGAAAATAFWGVSPSLPVSTGPMRVKLDLRGLERGINGQDLTISPDGGAVVYFARQPDHLNVRWMAQLGVALLRGTDEESGFNPSVSPDQEWVAFADSRGQQTRLNKVPLLGGRPVLLAELPSGVRGISWREDDIVVGTAGDGLFLAPSGGGEPAPLTIIDQAKGEASHSWPFFVRSANAVLFVIRRSTDTVVTSELAVLDLETEVVTTLGVAGTSPRYVSTGHLLYAAKDGALYASPFDVGRLEVRGAPVPLTQRIIVKPSGAADFAVSDGGRLVYVATAPKVEQRSLVWVDRESRETPIAAPPRGYQSPRISPDATRIVLTLGEAGTDIWTWDLARSLLTNVTSSASQDECPLWTPNGERILFSSDRDGFFRLYGISAEGAGDAEPLNYGAEGLAQAPLAVSADGTRLVFRDWTDRRFDLRQVFLEGDHVTEDLLSTEFDEQGAELSPDGRWIAYESNRSGRSQIYVSPFPGVETSRTLVSVGAGGTRPAWAPSGRELFYVADGSRLMSVPVDTHPGFVSQPPVELFDVSAYFFGGGGRGYDVAPDGRFLFVKSGGPQPGEDANPLQVIMVENWFEELKRLTPGD